ncbi:MAG: hydrogenase expression/formation protein HypE [Balneolales bacterium]|nr:hydrogenase expression/formation protein HypE [Balneolales bacterium]
MLPIISMWAGGIMKAEDKRPVVKLSCAAPAAEFTQITLSHGSGGTQMRQLLQQYVFECLNNDWLQKQEDAAILQVEGPFAFSTDTFVVSPLFFPGGDIGDLAVNGTINDLAVSGALPQYLSLAFILEEGFSSASFLRILQSIRRCCAAAGAAIVTGDTKVLERGKGDGIFINTSGIGRLRVGVQLGVSFLKDNDCLLVSGPLARHGIAVMSRRKGIGFETSIQSDTQPLHEICGMLSDALGTDLHLMRDATRGGVGTILHEITSQSRFSAEIEESALPVEQEVAGACEMLGLDPLFVANEGVFVAAVAAHKATEALALLRSHRFGQQAALIGRLRSDLRAPVVLNSTIGGRRVLPPMRGELLPRIC